MQPVVQSVDAGILKQWTVQQDELRAAVRTQDDWGTHDEWGGDLTKHIRFVGGLDISFHDPSATDHPDRPSSRVEAIASLVVLSFPTLDLAYQDHLVIESFSQPYIPGYLAFREVPHYETLLQRAQATPFYPTVVLVDGCGILHPRQCGSACHLGVTVGVPSIGVAKNLLAVEGGCQGNKEVQEQLNALWDHPPDACNLDWLGLPPNTPPLPPHCRAFPLYGNRAVENAERGHAVENAERGHAVENVRGNGEGMVSSTGNVQDLPDQPQLCNKHPILLGAAVSVAHKQRPVYVSVGHRVSLATAVRLVVACCRYRIPEPIRQADILSRAMLMSSTHNLRPQRIAGDE